MSYIIKNRRDGYDVFSRCDQCGNEDSHGHYSGLSLPNAECPVCEIPQHQEMLDSHEGMCGRCAIEMYTARTDPTLNERSTQINLSLAMCDECGQPIGKTVVSE